MNGEDIKDIYMRLGAVEMQCGRLESHMISEFGQMGDGRGNMYRTLDEVKSKIDNIEKALNNKPCNIHDADMVWHGRAIKGLISAFMVYLIGGVVFGIWVRSIITGGFGNG